MAGKDLCIGIDLGTTNSCVAIYKENGQVDIIVNENGNRTTPSYVSFQGNERYIGDQAKKDCGQNPKNTVYDVKRLIGTKFSDPVVQNDMKHMTFNIVPDSNDKPLIQVDYMDEKKTFCPEEISSMILGKLKDVASNFIGQEIKKAVVTVPAYFSDSQRQATKDAGEIAGLEVIRIINEPTAAAMAYGIANGDKGERNVLVYDLGGGTLDVTVLVIDDGAFEVKSTSGDTHLGGEDFDNKLKDYCFMKFCNQYILKTKLSEEQKKEVLSILDVKSFAGVHSIGVNIIKKAIKTTDINGDIEEYLNELVSVNKLYENSKLMRRLKTACEDAKKSLSTNNNITVSYDNFYDGEDLSVKISRSKFETICEREFNKCMTPVDKALEDAKLGSIQIHDVVLVGGSTRVPKIQELLNERFPDKLRSNINPDEAVAHGAAINAALVNGVKDTVIDSLVLIDVTPLSLGLETAGGVMEIMIKRNSTLPADAKQVFSTQTDNQPAVTVKVFEGERTKTEHNNLLGKFELSNLTAMPKGMPRIEVTFTVDTNGIMNVSAKELTSGADNEKSITIKNEKGRLNKEDISKMIENAEEYQEHDKIIRDKIDAKNSLENYMASCKRILGNEQFRSQISDEEAKELSDLIIDVIDWIDEIEDDEEQYTKITKEDYDSQYKLLESNFLPRLEELSNKSNVKVKGKKENNENTENIDNNKLNIS